MTGLLGAIKRKRDLWRLKYIRWQRRRARRRLKRARRNRIQLEELAEEYDEFPRPLTLYWICRLAWTDTVRRAFP